MEQQERPAPEAGSGWANPDGQPSTSEAARSNRSHATEGLGQGRRQHRYDPVAAKLMRRITRSLNVSELEEVVRRYWGQLNPTHVAAAIVKLAKLTSCFGDAQQDGRPQQTPRRRPSHHTTPTGPDQPGTWQGQHSEAMAASSGLGMHEVRSGQAVGDQDLGLGTTALRPGRRRPQPSHPDAASAGPRPPDAAPGPPAHPFFSALCSDFLAVQHTFDSARQFANVVWALGVLCNPPLRWQPPPQLLPAAASVLLADGGARLFTALPQELSNLALGLAKLGYEEVPLWSAINAAAKRRLPDFKPQELHNLTWAVATASQDRSIISAAVQAALPQLGRFNPSGLANLLWACAAAQCECGELFEGAAAALLAVPLEKLYSQDVANAAWAYAKLQHPHPRLMAHLAGWLLGGVPGRLRYSETRELVSMLWAFASQPPAAVTPVAGSAAVTADGPGEVAAAAADSSLCRGGPGRGNTSSVALGEDPPLGPPPGPAGHAAAAAISAKGADGGVTSTGSGDLIPRLLGLVLPELARRTDLTPQGASNALWALARLQPCPLPAPHLAALLRAAAAHAGSMSEQELSNTLWAAGELRDTGHWVPPDTVSPLMSAACCPQRLESQCPAVLAQLLHAAVKLRLARRGGDPMDALARRLLGALPGCGPQELCVAAAELAEAVHVSRYCNPILLNRLGDVAAARVGEMTPQGLSTLIWSFARAKQYHGPLLSAICREAGPRLREFSGWELSSLVAALALLRCPDRQLLGRVARVVMARVRLRSVQPAALQAAGAEAPPVPLQPLTPRLGPGQAALAVSAGRQWLHEESVPTAGTGFRHMVEQQLRIARGHDGEAVAGPSGRRGDSAGGVPALQSSYTASRRESSCSGSDACSSGHSDAGSDSSSSGHPTAGPPAPQPGLQAHSTGHTRADAAAAFQLPAAVSRHHVSHDPRPVLRHLPPSPHSEASRIALPPRRPPPHDSGSDAACRDYGPTSYGSAGEGSDGLRFGAAPAADVDLGGTYSDCGPDGGAAASTAQGHAKSMCKLLWGFARCNLYSAPLYRLLASELRPLLHVLTPHELTQVLWAVASQGHACPDLMDAAVPAVLASAPRLSPWDGSVVAWCYAKLGRPQRGLLEVLQRQAVRQWRAYREPALCRLAWACTALEVPLAEPLRARLHEARRNAAAGAGAGSAGRWTGEARSSYDGQDGEPPETSNAGRFDPER